MIMDLPLKNIAREALDTFPPLAKDRDTASNYAQRMLTKHISEMRKSGQAVSDTDAQEQRQILDDLINSLDVPATPDSAPKSDNVDIEDEKPTEQFYTEQITAVISTCFHTPTDGSAKHLAVLRNRAASEVNQYLSDANIGWAEKRRLKSKGKRLIDMHMKDISPENGNAGNGDAS